jgi:hypothetical protein
MAWLRFALSFLIPWSMVYERITLFDPPREFNYVLCKGMPGLDHHLGKVIVDTLTPEQSEVRWEIDFEFRSYHPFNLIVPNFKKIFEKEIDEAVLELKRQMEST